MAQKTRTDKMDTSKLSDEDLQDMFTEAYEKQVAFENAFDNYECICKRETGIPTVTMEVTVVGMAGTPTLDDYKNGKVKNSKSVVITREGRGSLRFDLDPKSVISLNSNDYLAVYKSI